MRFSAGVAITGSVRIEKEAGTWVPKWNLTMRPCIHRRDWVLVVLGANGAQFTFSALINKSSMYFTELTKPVINFDSFSNTQMQYLGTGLRSRDWALVFLGEIGVGNLVMAFFNIFDFINLLLSVYGSNWV